MEEQLSDQIEDLRHLGETSLFWGVQIRDITQKLDIMKLPFQVKHHTIPPGFISFFARTTGAIKFKKVAQALNVIIFFCHLTVGRDPSKSMLMGLFLIGHPKRC